MNEYMMFRSLQRGAKLLLAFSGGIDSTMAACACQQAGMEVRGAYMRLLDSFSEEQEDRVRKSAEAIGMPLDILDLRREFKERVMRRCWEEYAAGRTPNPCVICNPVFKFGELIRYAKEQGCAGIVTGHYARIVEESDGSCALYRGIDTGKDQSYFMYGLSQEQLRFSYMPLGMCRKIQVREEVRELSLPNAEAPESQDACFTPKEGSLSEMLRTLFHGEAKAGDFIHLRTGKVLGHHCGIHQYTIGQRKGTGVALGKPAYVHSLDADTGRVYIADDNECLMRRGLLLRKPHWQSGMNNPTEKFRADVQIRYRGKPASALLLPRPDGSLEIQFDQPQRAVTPGQSAVIYDGEKLLGGAIIEQY